jgi:hypothetical protein
MTPKRAPRKQISSRRSKPKQSGRGSRAEATVASKSGLNLDCCKPWKAYIQGDI